MRVPGSYIPAGQVGKIVRSFALICGLLLLKISGCTRQPSWESPSFLFCEGLFGCISALFVYAYPWNRHSEKRAYRALCGAAALLLVDDLQAVVLRCLMLNPATPGVFPTLAEIGRMAQAHVF